METCKWVVREGTHNTFWAFTPCKNGFNYLSKVHKASEMNYHDRCYRKWFLQYHAV